MGDIVINTERLVLKTLGTQYLQTTNEFALDTENTRHMEFLPFDDSDETLEYLKMVEREATKDNPVVL